VDADLVAVAQEAVAQGRADSVSAWVNEALRLKVAHDRRLRALEEFVAAFEAEHGEITEAQMSEAARRARGRAVVVRGGPGSAGRAGGARGRLRCWCWMPGRSWRSSVETGTWRR